jgi:UDP-4-amino-4,6-dideoxy-N-acetyl-beta-L-altrosamine transaminase
MTSFLPYGRQTIEDDDVAAVAAALRADYLTTGPTVAAFEQAFATATGAEHAVACNSGTAALHLAVLALDLGPGDCAIVPSMTFLATANCVRMTGAEVVFADVDPDNGLMTPQTLEEALARVPSGLQARVVLPVHLNGQVCDLEALSHVAKRHGVDIVEDACHALGEVDVGAARRSRAACFSTHPVKAIATGEGGVITTAEAPLAERMRALRSHGIVRGEAMTDRALSFNGSESNPWSYEMPEIGWNYRMPDVLCALGLSQLTKLSRFMARRRALVALYDRLLAPLAPRLRPVSHGNAPHGWHIYAVLIDFVALGKSRKSVMEALRGEGIGTQVHYIPVHRQPYYRDRYGDIVLPGADAYFARCLSIPFYPLLTDDDARRVASALERVVSR